MKRNIPLLLLAMALHGPLSAQTGSVDPGFNVGTGANNTVRAFLVQPDGNVVMSGAHSLYNGSSANTIVRLDVYGAVDPGFSVGTGANNYISAMALQPDGKILIGGAFTSYNGTGRNYIARINANGSLDATFNPGTGANQRVEAIVVQPDGKILIGGAFQNFNGSGRNRIARLNANGTVDAGFVPGTGANQNVEALALQSDGKVLVGGSFTSFNGTALNSIARLNSNGSLDLTFTPGTGASATIWDMALQPDGKLVVGGEFTTFNGTARGRIARLNTDGSLDLTFATGSGLSAICRRLEMHGGGKVLVAGNFTSANGVGRNRIARLNADGSTDVAFNPGMGLNNGEAWALAARPNGKVLLGGSFTLFNSTAKNRVVQLRGDDCPLLGVNIGSACDDGDPNTLGDAYNNSCTCVGTCNGNQVVLLITTDAHADQLSWVFTDGSNNTIATGSLTAADNSTTVQRTVCLENHYVGPSFYGFRLMDSFGDGITGGGWELQTTDGKVILRDTFSGGARTPDALPLTPGYTNHGFSLPLGSANIETARCGVFNYALGNKIFCNKVTGATQYEFEFTDPDAGFSRRVTKTTNYVQFWDMVTDPLTPGVKYFVRVRSDKDGPLASAHWGAGCEVGLGIAETVLCSALIPAPLYGHSCSEERTFGTNNSFIYATPVTGATEYQFRIYNLDEGYDTVITRNTYILQLKWVPKPLVDGNTYHVQLNVKVNGLYSGFCASSCTIIINNNPDLHERLVPAMGAPEAILWPNPNDGQLLNVAVHGIDEQVTTASVRLLDLTGRMALGTQLPVANGTLNSILDLDGAANGTYLLQITAGDRTWTERVVVNR